jgi:hypothetical protein
MFPNHTFETRVTTLIAWSLLLSFVVSRLVG